MVSFEALRSAVLTEQAELASEQLMLSAAEHEQFRRATARLGGGPTDGEALALSYVMRCVILVEVFVFGRAIELSDGHAASIVSPLFDQLYKAHRKQITSSWENARKALKLHGGIEPARYLEEPAMRGYIVARNSWAHGAGLLTERQRSEYRSSERALIDANFSIRDGRVVVEPEQVLGVARVCRRYVQKVDQGTRSRLN